MRLLSRNQRRRKGAELVELALTLPLLTLLVFGSLELCELVFLRQSLAITSYEGARLACRRTATSAQVVDRCNTMLTQRRVHGGTVTLTPATIDTLPRGTEVTITIAAPAQANSTTRFVLPGTNVTQTTTMLRE